MAAALPAPLPYWSAPSDAPGPLHAEWGGSWTAVAGRLPWEEPEPRQPALIQEPGKSGLEQLREITRQPFLLPLTSQRHAGFCLEPETISIW